MAKMTNAQYEKSAADRAMDKRLAKKGVKEGSPADRAADKKLKAKLEKKRR